MKPEHFNILRNKFPANEFALLDEVRDAAGHYASRSADAVAFGLWPSRGHELHGIEVKSSRVDWLKEQKNPQKAEAIFKYCNRFWLLATNESVVLNESEIPKNWGYLLIKGDRLKTIKEAPELKPKQLDKSFIAALLKRATGRMIHSHEIDGKIKSAIEEGRRQGSEHGVKMDLARLNSSSKQIEQYSENLKRLCTRIANEVFFIERIVDKPEE